MSWVRNKIRAWLSGGDMPKINNGIGLRSTCYDDHDNRPGGEPMRLHVWHARGGTIIETRTYDKQRDRTDTLLHIVTQDQDLGASLANIITMESLRG